jgi:sterol 24-C-methyltransferase
MTTPKLTDLYRSALPRDAVQATAATYQAQIDAEARRADYGATTNRFFNLVTDFYEYGWGQSFHFAPRHRGEEFAASIVRSELYVALRLGLHAGMAVLDAGCGVGGPMRTIARASRASIVGVTNNAYHVARARLHNRAARLDDLCRVVQGDFMALPLASASLDAAYQIEATPHAPDLAGVYAEICRVLKPGACLAGYEWCLTDIYDDDNAEHRALRQAIELGNGLPRLRRPSEVLAALEAAGFETLDSEDTAPRSDPETPWYLPLSGRRWFTLSGFRSSPAGRSLTNVLVRGLETVRAVPRGAGEVSRFLNRTATVMVRAGEAGIFTPSFFTLARRPAGR